VSLDLETYFLPKKFLWIWQLALLSQLRSSFDARSLLVLLSPRLHLAPLMSRLTVSRMTGVSLYTVCPFLNWGSTTPSFSFNELPTTTSPSTASSSPSLPFSLPPNSLCHLHLLPLLLPTSLHHLSLLSSHPTLLYHVSGTTRPAFQGFQQDGRRTLARARTHQGDQTDHPRGCVPSCKYSSDISLSVESRKTDALSERAGPRRRWNDLLHGRGLPSLLPARESFRSPSLAPEKAYLMIIFASAVSRRLPWSRSEEGKSYLAEEISHVGHGDHPLVSFRVRPRNEPRCYWRYPLVSDGKLLCCNPPLPPPPLLSFSSALSRATLVVLLPH